MDMIDRLDELDKYRKHDEGYASKDALCATNKAAHTNDE